MLEGKQEGKQEGLLEGKQKGLIEGELKEKQEVALKMKQKGLDIEFIQEITGLSKKEIEKL